MSSDPTHSVVLVVSTGRTGTKALATHLGKCCPDVTAFHEPRPTRFHLRRIGNRFLCGRLGHSDLVDTLRAHRDRMLAQAPARCYVESNPALSGFLDAFGEVFDDLRIVHVVRDPRTYVVSSLNWGVFTGARRALAHYMPYWLPKPERMRNVPEIAPGLRMPERRWAKLSPVARLAWHWAMINRHLERGESLYGGRYLRVRYEDLFSRDGSGWGQLLGWMGVPMNEAVPAEANRENVNASQKRRVPKFAEWRAEDREALFEYCGELMERYGYFDVAGERGSGMAPAQTLSGRRVQVA